MTSAEPTRSVHSDPPSIPETPEPAASPRRLLITAEDGDDDDLSGLSAAWVKWCVAGLCAVAACALLAVAQSKAGAAENVAAAAPPAAAEEPAPPPAPEPPPAAPTTSPRADEAARAAPPPNAAANNRRAAAAAAPVRTRTRAQRPSLGGHRVALDRSGPRAEQPAAVAPGEPEAASAAIATAIENPY